MRQRDAERVALCFSHPFTPPERLFGPVIGVEERSGAQGMPVNAFGTILFCGERAAFEECPAIYTYADAPAPVHIEPNGKQSRNGAFISLLLPVGREKE